MGRVKIVACSNHHPEADEYSFILTCEKYFYVEERVASNCL